MYTRVICSFPSPRTPSACTAGFWFYSTSTNSIYVCIVDSPLQAPRYTQGSSPWAPKATRGSVACACMLVSPLYLNRLCICICMYERINVDMYMHMSIYTSFFFFPSPPVPSAYTVGYWFYSTSTKNSLCIVCVCVYVCMCVCAYMYIYIYVWACVFPSLASRSERVHCRLLVLFDKYECYICMCLCICMYQRICVYAYVCMYVYMYMSVPSPLYLTVFTAGCSLHCTSQNIVYICV